MSCQLSVQDKKIDLTLASGRQLSNVRNGQTILFPPGAELTVEIPKTDPSPLSIRTFGIEDDLFCCDVILGATNDAYSPPGYGVGPHIEISDTSDFTLAYFISRLDSPGPVINARS